MPVDVSTSLRNLDPDVNVKLAECLDNGVDGNNWRSLIPHMKPCLLTPSEVERIALGMSTLQQSPTQQMLSLLGKKGLKVGHLIEWLDKLRLEKPLLLLRPYEPISVDRDLPPTLQLEEGDNLHLKLESRGFPYPKYQWYFRPSGSDTLKKIHGAQDAAYELSHVPSDKTGTYMCKTGNGSRETFRNSRECYVDVKPISTKTGIKRPEEPKKGEKLVIDFPEAAGELELPRGFPVTLEVRARGPGVLAYLWFKDNASLHNETQSALQLRELEGCHVGVYHCQVRSGNQAALSPPTQLKMKVASDPFATDKVALLIGNGFYRHGGPLSAIYNDVRDVGCKLEGLGFRTMTLVDLETEHIRNAVRYLCNKLKPDKPRKPGDNGPYVVFMFVGHGMELNQGQRGGELYLAGIDTLMMEPFDPRNMVSAGWVLDQIQKVSPAMSLLLLDVCRKHYETRSEVFTYSPKVEGHNVIMYATLKGRKSFEPEKPGYSIFTGHLLKHLASNITFVEMYQNICRDMGEDTRLTDKSIEERKQIPQLRMDVTDMRNRKLSDRVSGEAWSGVYRDRAREWDMARGQEEYLLDRDAEFEFRELGMRLRVQQRAEYSNRLVVGVAVVAPGFTEAATVIGCYTADSGKKPGQPDLPPHKCVVDELHKLHNGLSIQALLEYRLPGELTLSYKRIQVPLKDERPLVAKAQLNRKCTSPEEGEERKAGVDVYRQQPVESSSLGSQPPAQSRQDSEDLSSDPSSGHNRLYSHQHQHGVAGSGGPVGYYPAHHAMYVSQPNGEVMMPAGPPHHAPMPAAGYGYQVVNGGNNAMPVMYAASPPVAYHVQAGPGAGQYQPGPGAQYSGPPPFSDPIQTGSPPQYHSSSSSQYYYDSPQSSSALYTGSSSYPSSLSQPQELSQETLAITAQMHQMGLSEGRSVGAAGGVGGQGGEMQNGLLRQTSSQC